MIVRTFLAWSETASVAQRSRAASALTAAYLLSQFDDADRADAETALTALLDDPSPQVRRALADGLADAADAPHSIVLALAGDCEDIAATVLRRSPVLGEDDLFECLCDGASAQRAIASRQTLSPTLSAALAERGDRECVLMLVCNRRVALNDATLSRIVDRYGEDGAVREAILSHRTLTSCLRSRLVEATALSLSAFVVGCQWMGAERAERTRGESCERAAAVIASDANAGSDGVSVYVRHLRANGRLTAALLLRALLGGDRAFVEAALAELSGFTAQRICGLMRNRAGAGFRAMVVRCGLPDWLVAPLRAALAVLDDFGIDHGYANTGALRFDLVEPVLRACEARRDPALSPVVAMLRRFLSEAAREEARIARPFFIASVRPAPSIRAAVQIDLQAIEAELLSEAA